MICTGCGENCITYIAEVGVSNVTLSVCCDSASFPGKHCPCENESKENCETCRDESTAKNAAKGLYSEDQIEDAINRAGVLEFVKDLIMEEIRGK